MVREHEADFLPFFEFWLPIGRSVSIRWFSVTVAKLRTDATHANNRVIVDCGEIFHKETFTYSKCNAGVSSVGVS